MTMFYAFLSIILIATFALPLIALIDVITSPKDDGLTDFERSASLLDRK